MAFDPDKYLASKSESSGFDPDAYLASKPAVKAAEVPGARVAKPKWATEYPRLYEAAKTAREVVGPTAEMLGSIGGGALGAAAGTVAAPTVVVNPVTGAVAGSALGYGIAKSALDMADELLGLKAAPKTAGEALSRGAENLATGAMYEMGGQVAGKALQKGAELVGKGASKVAGAVADVGQIPQQKAARVARAAAGEKLPEIQQALRQAPQGTTAAQAIANQIDPLTGKAVLNAPETQALLRTVEETRPTAFSDIKRAQDAATRNMLAEIAGAPTQAGAVSARAAQKEALNKLTTPMRETELAAANTAGQMLPGLEVKAAQKQASMVQALQDQGRMATESAQRAATAAQGKPGFLTQGDRAAEFADAANIMGRVKGQRQMEKAFTDYQIQSLEAHGLKPLEAAPVVNQIRSVLADPKYAANDIVRGAAENVAEEISKWTNKRGIIDADALEAIRKNAVDATIAKLRPGLDQTAQKQAASGVLAKIKPVIDDAIEAAGGTGWRNYLETHSAGMKELSKTKLGAEAMKLYSSSPQKFLDLVENNSPKTIQKIFGADTYDLVKAMGDETASRLQAAGQQIRRAKDIELQATEGQKAFDALLKDHFFKFQLPNMLNVATTSINKVLDILTGKVGKKTMDVLTNAAKDAKSFDALLNTVPATERSKILKALKDPATFEAAAQRVEKILPKSTRGGVAIGIDSATGGAGVNALAPSTNQNALAER